MNVTCPGCNTVYRVDPAKVPVLGVRARCQVCATVFAVRRPAEEAAVRSASTEPATLVRPAITRPSLMPEPPAPVVMAPPMTAPPPSAPARQPEPITVPTIKPPVFEPPARMPEPATEPSIRVPTFEPPAPRPPEPVTEPTIPVPHFDEPPAPPVHRATEPRIAQPADTVPTAPVRPPVMHPPVRPTMPPASPIAPRPTAPAGPPPASPTRAGNPFLTQDPNQKARRLARALISDLAVYFPDRRKKALAAGTLKAEFEEEIRKSWEEYTDQVGKPLAESTSHFTDALNEILASGQKVF